MKKSIAVMLLASALMLSACGNVDNSKVSESKETTEETTTETTTESTTESTTEATTESTEDERMLKMTGAEVAAAIKPAYGSELKDFNNTYESVYTGLTDNPNLDVDVKKYHKTYLEEENSKKGIKNFVSFGISNVDPDNFEKSYFIFIYVIEMDMNSDDYKALAVGSDIKPMIFSGDSGPVNEKLKVSAINGQYVIACCEMYQDGGKSVSNHASPFKYDGIDKVIKAFEELKNA